MSSDDTKITTQPEMRWRTIPGYSDYEMNLLEEVRHVAKKRKPWETPQDGQYIRLWKNGRMERISALALARRTWPEFYGRQEHEPNRDMNVRRL